MRNILFIYFLLPFSVLSQEKATFKNLDVFELEWAQNPQISPDGSKIVYQRSGFDIMNDQRSSRLWIMNTDGSRHSKLSNGEANEANAQWSPDGSQIVFTRSTKNGAEIFIYWLDSKKVARLTQLEKSPSNLAWSHDGKQIGFTMKVDAKQPSLVAPPKKPKGAKWAKHPRVTTRLKYEADGSGYTSPGFRHIFIISAEGGTARQVSKGDFNYNGFQWSKDNLHLYFSSNHNNNWEYETRNSEIYRLDIATGKVGALTDRNGPDRGLALSPDGKTIAYLGYDDKIQTFQVNQISLMNSDGSNKRVLATNLDRAKSNLQWSADGKGLYFTYDSEGNTKIGYVSLSGRTSKMANNLGGTAIGRPYGGGSYSVASNGTLTYTHTTPNHPAEIAIKSKGKPVRVISSLNNDLLAYRNLGKTEEIWYSSSVDANKIQGWIVYPPDFNPASKYPLLVENHGGPISNYGDRFSPEIQLYAAAGYVVFYPNPRGSTSYGEAFGNLLYHNYPGEDYNDVMDGVDAVIAKGFIDSDQLFVTGGSAGGIMTAWMIGKNNRFRAAAVVKPVMNWISKTLVADNYFYYADYRYPGQPWENFETYWKFSPLSLVGNIETPTLVMVGTADLRTPLSEAKQLYGALKIRQKETALVEIPGAYHGIARRPSQLITKVDHILAWFEKYKKN